MVRGPAPAPLLRPAGRERFLDEATNALDRPTERALRTAIEDGRNARAIIVIAHRRETLENADYVIVLGQGHVVEAGAPAQLLRLGGVYARLYLDEISSAERTSGLA